MAEYSHLKLLQLTAHRGDRPDGMESSEYNFCIDFIAKVDSFILNGLVRQKQPTKAHLDALICEAFKQYHFEIRLSLNKSTESEFQQFCYDRYHYKKDQTVKVLGKLFTFKHIDIFA